jgi:hypothetical protein
MVMSPQIILLVLGSDCVASMSVAEILCTEVIHSGIEANDWSLTRLIRDERKDER